MRSKQAFHLRLALFLLVMSLLSPLVSAPALAQDDADQDPGSLQAATGTLLIKLQSEGGALLGGGSFHVIDANGADSWVADGDDGSADGVTTVNGLAAGWATVYQTGSPAGYIATTVELGAPVQANTSVDLWVTNAAEVVEAPPPPPPDDDADGVINDSDNCTSVSNPGQTDSDGDGLGDACDETPLPDNDGDGVDNTNDNCPDVANVDQVDADSDGAGDACDETPDGDIVDTDGDGVANDVDLCPDLADPDQLDTDADGLGNACDDDDDGDGLSDAAEATAGSDPLLADTDADGVLDGVDNCVIDANKNQKDKDGDGVGDACSIPTPDGSPTADAGRLIGALTTTVTAVDIDFAAPDPTTYDHNSATGLGGIYPGDELETLNGGDFKCGEYVHYWNRITVDSGSGSLDFVNGFATTTSNGDLVGFDAIGSVYIDTANGTDTGTPASVTYTTSSTASEVIANITVSGLDEGDEIFVRTTARLYCDTDTAGGVIQGRVHSDLAGDQTVNLTAAGQIETFGISITKSCLTVIGSGARIGSVVQYTVTITNTGNTTLNDVVVTDNRTGTFDTPFSTSLAAGDSESRTFSTTITAADVAEGSVNNTASVVSDQTTLTSATAECPFTPVSGVSIAKECPTIPPGARVGDEITYEVTIENTGDTALSGIVVTDARDGSFSPAFPTTLAVGDTATSTFTSTITPADVTAGNVNNTASVDSDQTALVSDTAECSFTPVSGLTISKSCPTISAGARVGDAIAYTVTIENTGDTTLTNIVVTDTRSGNFDSPFPTTLAPDSDPVSRTFTSTITAADVTAGNLNNTASVDSDQTTLTSATATCTFTPVSSVTIDKSCPTIPAETRIGATITYGITVTNTGDTTLTSVDITDSRTGTFSPPRPTTLAPGASYIGTFVTTLTAADVAASSVNNTASVDSDQTALVSDSANCPFNPVEGISIEKSCPTVAADARIGSSITYTVTITNTGDVPLTNVVVTETRSGTLDSPFPTTLAAGGTATRTFTSTITAADAAAGTVDNTAAVTADAGAVPVSDSFDADCPFTPITGVSITKTCPTIAPGARIGSTITYQVTVENTSDVALTALAVTDDRTGSFDTPFPTTLAAGATATRTFTSTITAADALAGNVDNGASVSASATVGNVVTAVSDEVTAECPFSPESGIEITKTCPTVAASARVGDSVTYSVTITNTGDLPLTDVVFSDVRAGTLSAPFPTTLAVGGSATRVFTSTITLADAAAGNVDNDASVTASVNGTQATVADSVQANCPFNPVEGIEITKTCPTIPADARAGDAIEYEVTIENTGDVTITGIVVLDDRAGSFDSAFPTTLAAGASATRTFTSTIALADAANENVDNSASVTGSAGTVAVSDEVTARCPFNPLSGIEISKSCPTIAAGARVGDEIAYEVTIENIGDTVLTGIVVSDTRTGSFDSAFPTTLDPGDTETRTFTSTITAADAAAGNVNNTASVTATVGAASAALPAGAHAFGVVVSLAQTAVSDTDTAECPFTPVKGVDIEKSCPTVAAGARVGDEVTYSVTLRNTGDIILTGVVVTDDRTGTFDSPFPVALAPGQEETRTFTSTITAADAADGSLDNTVSVNTTQAVSDTDIVECTFSPVTGLEIEKSCPTLTQGIRVGSSITYQVTVRNSGDVALANVAVSDTRDGSFDTAFPTTFAPGQEVTRTFTSTITAADAAAGNVDNSATVSANVGESEVEVTDTATAECPFISVASVEIEKSCPTVAKGSRVGDEITYQVIVTNTGDVPVSILEVADSRDGSFDSPFPDQLAPGASVTRTFTSTITADDVLGENVDNSATVIVGIGESDIELTATVDAKCPFEPVSGIEITKSCPVLKSGPKLGDSIAYDVVITNTGDTALMIFEVIDSREGEWNEAFPEGLAPGESVTRTFTSTITANDLKYGNVDNEVTVTAMPFPPGDDGTPEPTQVTMVAGDDTNGVHAFMQADEEAALTATAVADCPVEIPKETPTPTPTPTDVPPTPPATPVTILPVTGQGTGAASAASATLVLVLVAGLLMATAGIRIRADARRRR